MQGAVGSSLARERGKRHAPVRTCAMECAVPPLDSRINGESAAAQHSIGL